MKKVECSVENPSEHWAFIECEGKIAIDLGCGRWEHVEYRDPSWPTTPEWLLLKGAAYVHAYDIDKREVDWYNSTLSPIKNITAYEKSINTVDDIREILKSHNPKVVKCDIEHYEAAFLGLTDEEFSSIDFYAIETHSDQLYNSFIEKFSLLNYELIAIVDLVHARPMKAIFARKK